MLPGREKKGGGKRSKRSWRKDCELYCTLWIGYKSWLQELLRWRNSYLLTLRSNLQSPSGRGMIYVLQSHQDWAPVKQMHTDTCSVSHGEQTPSPRLCCMAMRWWPEEGLRSGSRGAWCAGTGRRRMLVSPDLCLLMSSRGSCGSPFLAQRCAHKSRQQREG